MSKKAWIIFVVVCAVVLGGLVFLSRGNQVNVSSVDASKIVSANEQNGNIADHVFGSTNGKAILIEYGDFACPACASAYPNVHDLTEEYKDKLTFIFRNLPLTSMHPNARAAAAAAESAGLQGKYWQMHDILYQRQTSWANVSSEERLGIFEGYAKEVGVKDMATFKTDMQADTVASKINFDMALAKKVGATATPTIFLDGKRIESDVWSEKDKFKSAIEEALK